MELPKLFFDGMERAETAYDIVALCYECLLSYKNDRDVNFLAEVGHLSRHPRYGRYATDFEKLRSNLLLLSNGIGVMGFEIGLDFDDYKNGFIDVLTAFSKPDDINDGDFNSICLFYALEALDTYICKIVESEYESYQIFGPLNNKMDGVDSVVYLQERPNWSLLRGVYEPFDDQPPRKPQFRKPLRETRIGTEFRSVLVMQSKDFDAATPVIVPMFVPDELSELLDRHIRIASIPYIGFRTIKAYEMGSQHACDNFENLQGAFRVAYDDNDDDAKRAVELLRLAIEKEANIIVFPEFIMSQKMLSAVKSFLSGLGKLQKGKLLLVVAGTNYQCYSEGGGDNVMHILKSDGAEIGCYYKYHPFLTREHECFHGTSLEAKKEEMADVHRKYLLNCEVLSNPGNKCTLVEVQKIGRILPAICRDVIDGHYTDKLVKLFMPSMLLVPAWSRSVASFDLRLSEIAETLHTTSLLCNCCDAVKRKTDNVTSIGKIVHPSISGTTMKATMLENERTLACMKVCKERAGCVVLFDIELSQGVPHINKEHLYADGREVKEEVN